MQRIRITLPALLILSTFILAAPMWALAIEVAPRITDREIVERLAKLEQGQQFLIQHMDQRFADMQRNMDQRFGDIDKRFDGMNQRITEQHHTTLAIYGSLIALIIALFGYIAYDRRTMFRPIKERLERIEQELRIEPDRPTRPSPPRSKASSDVKPPDSAVHGAARA